MPREYAELEAVARSRKLPIHHCEREVFGTSHAEVGAYLLGLWGLPFEVVQAVAAHHSDLNELERLDVTAAVAIASSQARTLLFGPEAAAMYIDPVPFDALRRFDVVEKLSAITMDVIRQRGAREREAR
jgi:HD-like signal output (HDOD) protein